MILIFWMNNNEIQMTRDMFAVNRIQQNVGEEPTAFGHIKNSSNLTLTIRGRCVQVSSKWKLEWSELVLSRLVRELVPGGVGRLMAAGCSISEHKGHLETHRHLCSKGMDGVHYSKILQNTSSLYQNIQAHLMVRSFRNRLIIFIKISIKNEVSFHFFIG